MPNTTIFRGSRRNLRRELRTPIGLDGRQGTVGHDGDTRQTRVNLGRHPNRLLRRAPENSSIRSGRQRGSAARDWSYRSGAYYVSSKQDVWLKNAGGLYEEALQRQWSSATDIPWETIEPLPDDIERAACQFTTFLSEIEFIAADVPGRWVASISPDYLRPVCS